MSSVAVPANPEHIGNTPGALRRATVALVAITIATKVLGFGEKLVIAYYFGADERVDAYFVALSVPLALFVFVRELIEPAFLPLFVGRLDDDRPSRAWQLFTAIGLIVIASTSIAVGVCWLHADAVVAALAPGFDEETRLLAGELLRWTIPGGLLLALSSVTSITLNGYRRFALPASGDLAMKVFPIACAVLLAPELGVFSLALGLLLGCAGRLVVHTWGLRREFGWLSWPGPQSSGDLRALALLMAPLVLGVFFSQLSELADNYFSSKVGAGAIAARTFARRIVDLPTLVLPYALSVVVFPYFSSLAHHEEWDRLFSSLGRSVRGLALVFAFLSVAAVLLADPLVTFLLERGAFDVRGRELTAWALKLYGLGLVAFAIEALLVPFYFAMRDTRTPVLIGIGGVAVNVALSAALIESMGVGGVAIALTSSKTLKVLLLVALLRRKRNSLRFAPIFASGLRIGLSAAAAALSIYGFSAVLGEPGPGTSLLEQFALLAGASMVGATLFVLVTISRDSPERSLIFSGLLFLRATISSQRRSAR